MYSPKDLEGEVDHSFFDNDCDVSGTNPDEPVHPEEEDMDSTNEKLLDQAENERNVEECESKTLITKETEKEERGVETSSRVGEEEEAEKTEDPSEEKDHFKKEDPAHGEEDTSSRKSSPRPHSDLSNSSYDSQSDDSSSEDDGYYRNETTKSSTGKSCTRSRSHSASSSFAERSPVPHTRATSYPWRQPQPGSANRKQRHQTAERDDSDDTVTDVTPLSSPDISPQQSLGLAPPTSTRSTLPSTIETNDGQKLDVNTHGEERFTMLSAGRRMDRALLVFSPSSASISSSRTSASQRHKNYSFSRDEVRHIERENQRLLHNLSLSSAHSTFRSTFHSSMPPFRPHHSALNRQREQKRIQQENLAFIKRLESTKATPGMARLEQLRDYQRQAGYLGIPTPFIRPTSGRTTRTCSPHRTSPETSKPYKTMAWS